MQITETSGGTITSTKQFVWWGNEMCEARNASSAVTAQYFSFGETINGTSYYYTKDHLGSIRELTNSSGAIQSQYGYDPYGQVTKIAGSGPASDFQYAGYYYHAPSGLNLTLNRAYNSNLGRWINRDPIEEAGGLNLYGYVNNAPTQFTDPEGLDNKKCGNNPPKQKAPTGQAPQPRAPQPPLIPKNSQGSTPPWWPKNWAWPPKLPPWWPPFMDPENWPDPFNDYARARQRMSDLGVPNAWPIPSGFPFNWNPPPVPENYSGPPPFIWPGSEPWNPSATKPFNGTA